MESNTYSRRTALKLMGFSAVSVFTSNSLPAQQQAQRPVHPSLVQIEDEPGLPRVLLIGDSISMGYTIAVRELLKGKTNVHHPPTNCGPTIKGIEQIEEWLGNEKWDVIHFNFGLHDIRYFDENKKPVDLPAGAHQVPIDQYEKNLSLLVERLKKTGAKLIWASTTPVPEGSPGRVAGDEVKYNAVAEKIMKKNGIIINDLYSFALPRLKNIQLPKNVHFHDDGSRDLAQQVEAAILKAL